MADRNDIYAQIAAQAYNNSLSDKIADENRQMYLEAMKNYVNLGIGTNKDNQQAVETTRNILGRATPYGSFGYDPYGFRNYNVNANRAYNDPSQMYVRKNEDTQQTLVNSGFTAIPRYDTNGNPILSTYPVSLQNRWYLQNAVIEPLRGASEKYNALTYQLSQTRDPVEAEQIKRELPSLWNQISKLSNAQRNLGDWIKLNEYGNYNLTIPPIYP